MRKFEVQAWNQYRQYAPILAVEHKRLVVETLTTLAPSDHPLEVSELADSMNRLIVSASTCQDSCDVLVVQGAVLERVREVIYGGVGASLGASDATRALAARAGSVSASLVEQAHDLFAAWSKSTDRPALSRFIESSDDVLHELDAVGEGVERVFGERFHLKSADVVGDFVAALVPSCVRLGMDRRKVMSHLAGALMGI